MAASGGHWQLGSRAVLMAAALLMALSDGGGIVGGGCGAQGGWHARIFQRPGDGCAHRGYHDSDSRSLSLSLSAP